MGLKIALIILFVLVFVGGIVAVMIIAIKKTDPKNIDQSMAQRNDTTREMLPFEDIRDSMIHLGNHQYRAVLSCTSINYALKTAKEQDVIELAFQRFLNSLSHPISIYNQTRIMDNEKMLKSLEADMIMAMEEFPIIKNYGDAYYNEMKNIYVNIGNNKEKKKYIIIPFDDAIELTASTDEEKYDYILQKMKNRILIVIDGLEAIGITASLLNTNDLIDLLYVAYHKDSANQSENLVNGEFLDLIVSGDNKLNNLTDEARLDWILYEAQVRLQTELGQVQDVNPIVAKKAEVGIKNINLIRNKLAGHYKTDRISEE